MLSTHSMTDIHSAKTDILFCEMSQRQCVSLLDGIDRRVQCNTCQLELMYSKWVSSASADVNTNMNVPDINADSRVAATVIYSSFDTKSNAHAQSSVWIVYDGMTVKFTVRTNLPRFSFVRRFCRNFFFHILISYSRLLWLNYIFVVWRRIYIYKMRTLTTIRPFPLKFYIIKFKANECRRTLVSEVSNFFAICRLWTGFDGELLHTQARLSEI